MPRFNRKDLQQMLSTVGGVIPSRPLLPAIGGVHLELTDKGLTAKATDQYCAMRGTIAADDIGEGFDVLASGTLLAQITKNLPGSDVQIHVTDDEITIASGSAKSDVPLLKLEDFPAIPDLPDSWDFSVKASEFSEVLGRVLIAPARPNSSGRQQLESVNMVLRILDGVVELGATNGYRLASDVCPVLGGSTDGSKEGASYLIAGPHLKTVRTLCNSLPEDAEIQIGTAHDNVFFRYGDKLCYSAGIVQEEYPNLDKVIPKNNDVEFSVNREALLGAVERAFITAPVESRAAGFFLRDGELRVASNSESNGSSSERVPLIASNGSVQVGFNCEYLIDALKVIKADEIKGQLKDDQTAVLITPIDETSKFRYVCMPVRNVCEKIEKGAFNGKA